MVTIQCLQLSHLLAVAVVVQMQAVILQLVWMVVLAVAVVTVQQLAVLAVLVIHHLQVLLKEITGQLVQISGTAEAAVALDLLAGQLVLGQVEMAVLVRLQVLLALA
jgi:hypothetical protein